MRSGVGAIWDIWSQGGPFVGEHKAVARVTVEEDYYLERAYVGDANKQPLRWFARDTAPIYDDSILTDTDYDDSWWGFARQIEQGTPTGPPRQAGAPGWPDPSSWWVWPTVGATPETPVPTGTVYFRRHFTLGAGTDATVYATADNSCDVYIDGTMVLTTGVSQFFGGQPAWKTTFHANVHLDAGQHVIAIKARNIPQIAVYEEVNYGNPAGVIAAVLSAAGAVLVRTDATWRSVGYLRVETEVPNVRSITTDSSIDNDAATAEITISNTTMAANGDPTPKPASAGFPGYFTFDRGASPAAAARWGHRVNRWAGVLTSNALLRTYQGYGGEDLSLPDAIAAGHLCCTGTWLVDKPRISAEGTIVLSCRDMAKLLIEQQLYPPLVPRAQYPLRYCRWMWRNEEVAHVVQDAPGASRGNRRLSYDTSASLAWYPGGVVHGHRPGDALDGNTDSFYLSVGNNGPDEPYSVEWVQGNCGDVIDTVYVHPMMGNYTCWVSIMENGAWVDEIGVIPYNPAGVGRYTGAYEARIPAVMRFGVPWESPVSVQLPRAYRADKVRFTFSHLARSQWGPYPYRAAVREVGASLSADVGPATHVESHLEAVKRDGNYKDFADIVKDLLLWSGWWLMNAAGEVAVYGNIESTGSYSEDCFADDTFDKKPVIDAITAVKQVVGYVFFVDNDGAARWESPNWWGPGNFYETGAHVEFIPELDEKIQVTGYTVEADDVDARSEIIISSEEPTANLSGTVTTRVIPATADLLKGMVRPAMFIEHLLTNAAEQKVMADLVSLHLWFRARQGSVTIAANPAIERNDQVRIWEQVCAESYIHYVRGITSNYDAESGVYTMTLTTHWLGDESTWAVVAKKTNATFGFYYHLPDSDVAIDPQGTPLGDVGPDGGFWGYGWHDLGGAAPPAVLPS